MTQSSDQQPVSCVLFGIGSAQSYYVHLAPAKWVKGSINPMSALWSALNSLLNALQCHLSSLLEGWHSPVEMILFDLMHVIGTEWRKGPTNNCRWSIGERFAKHQTARQLEYQILPAGICICIWFPNREDFAPEDKVLSLCLWLTPAGKRHTYSVTTVPTCLPHRVLVSGMRVKKKKNIQRPDTSTAGQSKLLLTGIFECTYW